MDKRYYVRLDVDNVGDNIELALLQANLVRAQQIHDSIQTALADIQKVLRFNCDILMQGCDDILFSISEIDYDENFLVELKDIFFEKTGFTISIGIGISINEAIGNLRIAKLSGKNRIYQE